MVGVQYDQQLNAVIFTANGSLALKDVVQAVHMWAQDDAFNSDINMLWDLGECAWQDAASEFFLISEQVINQVNSIWNGKQIALLVGTETEVALVDTHLALAGWDATWRGFSSRDAALNWLTNGNVSALTIPRVRDANDL